MVKKALLVGIAYRGFADGHRIDSAYYDVETMRELLTATLHFRREDITELKDSFSPDDPRYPSKENMMQAMSDLVAGAQRGDHLVFLCKSVLVATPPLICHSVLVAGHGSQKPGYMSKNEIDTLDEAIWPADAIPRDDWSDAENDIIDDTIKAILVDEADRVGAHLVIILDCCHSGTGADLAHSYVDEPQTTLTRKVEMKKLTDASKYSQSTAPIVSWAACQDPELTISLVQSGGVFVTAFSQACRKNPHATHREILHSVKEQMVSLAQKLHDKAKGNMSDKDLKKFEEWLDSVKSQPVLGILGDEDIALDTPVAAMFGLDAPGSAEN